MELSVASFVGGTMLESSTETLFLTTKKLITNKKNLLQY